MKILFVHNNFPAQFRHVARALSQDPGVDIAAIGSFTARPLRNVNLLKYNVSATDVAATHPFARRFDLECRRAEEVLYAASSLASSGFSPDVIVAHPGWGEALPLRAIFPKSRIIIYCEFYYNGTGQDVGFDLEFPTLGADGQVSLHLKNAATLLALSACNDAISPTLWQKSTYPSDFAHKIKVIHEGVDVDLFAPHPGAALHLPNGRSLSASDEVITFVARNLEPLRGYHIFMRALPRILAERPEAQVLIMGSDGTSYGQSPPTGQTWKDVFRNEVAGSIDQHRVHFLGHLPYRDYLRALQISSAHVYLTYPFVLSWSLLEAMSTGCPIIASDTPPVREVVNGDTGLLVPFFDTEGLARRVIEVLGAPRGFDKMRARAREFITAQYDAQRICIPKFLSLLDPNAPRPRRIRSHPKSAGAAESAPGLRT